MAGSRLMTTRLRAFLPAVVLCLGCAAVLRSSSQKSVPLARPLSVLPRVIGASRAVDVKINEDELRVAGVSDYLFRVFENHSATTFSVYVGYYESQTQGKTIHSPKNCLPGNGWDFVQTGARTIAMPRTKATINRSVVANESQRALVYYWYQGRGRVAANEYGVKWDLLRDAALRGRTEEALVRIVVPLTGNGDPAGELSEADTLAARVARTMISDVATVLPVWP